MHPNPTKGTCGKDCVKEKIKIDDNMIAKIGAALRTHVRLHMLFLDNNRITEAGAASVADCLKNKQDLRVFNIDYNHIGVNGAAKVSE